MHLVALGDSLTYGFDVPPISGWLARIKRQRPAWQIDNFGICGDSLPGICARLRPALRMIDPDLVFIMGGTNDILTRADMFRRGYDNGDDFCKPLYDAVARLEKREIPYFIGAPPLITRDSMYTGWQTLPGWEISRQALRDFGADLEIRFPGKILSFTDVLDDHRLFDDGVHPNIYGYERMAEVALPYFDKFANS